MDIGKNGSAYAVVSGGIRENVVNMVDGLLICDTVLVGTGEVIEKGRSARC